ncbi:hypothetical protein B2A_15197 [mine drainage metagenome]|uniref:Uncharacterized protein n=1 Tax=mine drainage metagenome TaxID=410659 RepID=T0XXN3_9ZZZZ
MDAVGDFVVTWQSFGQVLAGYYDIYAQRYSSSGAALGSEFLVNPVTLNTQLGSTGGSFVDESVAMDATGDFVVGWQEYGKNTTGTYYSGIGAQRYQGRLWPVRMRR